jgi:hypothetical protein
MLHITNADIAVEERIRMRSFASRHLTRPLLLGLLVAFSLAWPALAADKRTKPKQNGVDSAGMYSNYVDKGHSELDQYLGDTSPLTEAELVPSLLSAIDQLSKYPRPAFAPEIFRVPHERLEELACTSKCGVQATYQPGEGIFLDERLKPETNLFDRSVLLHELVHYVQELNHERGDARPCERWYYREVEAYAIQKSFLMLVGSPVRVGFHANKSTCVDVSR